MCGLPRTLEALVSMPSKQECEEHGERERRKREGKGSRRQSGRGGGGGSS